LTPARVEQLKGTDFAPLPAGTDPGTDRATALAAADRLVDAATN
jgi:hypothetical protein